MTERPALAALKAEILKTADPKEATAINAAFEVFTELLDNTARIAAALGSGDAGAEGDHNGLKIIGSRVTALEVRMATLGIPKS